MFSLHDFSRLCCATFVIGFSVAFLSPVFWSSTACVLQQTLYVFSIFIGSGILKDEQNSVSHKHSDFHLSFFQIQLAHDGILQLSQN